jgi:hypothetical protein
MGEGMGDVLGAVSRPRTVRKPLKAMSSGSGFVSCMRMPTSVVVVWEGRERRSDQPEGGESQKAVTTMEGEASV